MLELKEIRKQYGEGDSVINALNGVSLKFRENEFVSILGASGCGKTTLLNIVGGLDRYTSGDLIINGRSTKDFEDGDWDAYRNHSIGFVFQSYNLIPHQTVLSNVELALTLSGVSKAERRQRATEALQKVGLGDQLHKKPNQMSGGQMQRVAIARALVNNPDILLADEPTGALDTATSVQIMELLKEVAREKLVIMVTHNPDLANEYSTRIVRLSDGEVVDDTNPYDGAEFTVIDVPEALTKKQKKESKAKSKKKSMSFATAVSLSFNNLLTKKARTILTSFAGSIGIIGIALILSLSNGIQAYIDRVQEDTLSTYPLTLQKETQDFSAMLTAMTEVSEGNNGEIDENTIYVDDSMDKMISAMTATVSNDLEKFNKYLIDNYDQIKDSVSDIQYTYDFDLQVFNTNNDKFTQVSPTKIFESMGFGDMANMMGSMGSGMSVMSEMINNQELLDAQYELVGENSHWPTNANEVVLVVSKNNQISKMTLYMLGILDQNEIPDIMQQLAKGEYTPEEMPDFELDDFLGMRFRLLTTQDFFVKKTGDNNTYSVDGKDWPIWSERVFLTEDEKMSFVNENGEELVISGIVRPKAGVSATSISGAIGYTKALTDKILALNSDSEIINQQKATPTHDVLSGETFERKIYTPENIGELVNRISDDQIKLILQTYGSSIERPKVNAGNFSTMFNVMPNEAKQGLIMGMYGGAMQAAMLGVNQTPPDMTLKNKIDALFTAVNAAYGDKIELTSDNFSILLPSLSSQMDLLVYGNGTVDGLMSLAGEQTMSAIYGQMNESIAAMPVTKEAMISFLSTMPNDEGFKSMEEMLYNMVAVKDATYESTLKKLGDAEAAKPASINFYAKDFESKDNIEAFINGYNDTRENEAEEIQYTDLIGVMMSSVSLIINVISYVLIAFVSISLVVSSIMIGIITYISVLERTKEIGVLRSIGASKRDISRVFNAETLIVGLAAGLIGIICTILLCLPINAIIHALSGIDTINAVLPWVGGVALVLISMFLTFIAGLIPSRLAAKKDPVEALRTE